MHLLPFVNKVGHVTVSVREVRNKSTGSQKNYDFL